MKKFLKTVAILFLIVLLFSACRVDNSSYGPLVCGSYSVPGMFCYEIKGGTYTCNVLEQDSQGRILYEYTTKNVITQKEETALVICQKNEPECVYFYEDICYVFKGETAPDIDLLKERNDWGKELDESKMSGRVNQIAFEPNIVTPSKLAVHKVREACCEQLQIQSSQIRTLCIMDVDPAGQGLYWLVFEENGADVSYIVLTSTDYRVALLSANEGVPEADALATFKKENGWVYGVPSP